jgi:hypothetical protein
MGLDIGLGVDNYEAFSRSAGSLDNFYRHSLSRPFCWLICRQEIVYDVPSEIDQICNLAGVPPALFSDLQKYPYEEAEDLMMSIFANDLSEAEIKQQAARDRELYGNNIDTVAAHINTLIHRCSAIGSITPLLVFSKAEPLDWGDYFDNFNTDPGDGYIGNNFGQDMRNFQHFVSDAKAFGSKTVFFRFG